MQFFICRRRLFTCKTTPPSNLSLPDGGLCRDTNDLAKKQTYLVTFNRNLGMSNLRGLR